MSKEFIPTVRYLNYLDLSFEQSQDAISVFDLDDNIITCNRAFEQLYGWTLEECSEKPISFYPETEYEKVHARCELLYKGQSLANERVTEMRKDGTLFQAEISMTPIFNEFNEVVAISHIARDITSRLQMEQKTLEFERLQTMSMIAAKVAHEVRNPMTAITGFIQLMNQDPANPYSYFTEIMGKEISRVNQIVTDFLALAKPTLQDTAPVSILEVIEEMLIEFDEQFNECAISCQLNAEELELFIIGDKSSLHQVFYNILSNCCDAIEHTGNIIISLTNQEGTLHICIEDDGCGMDQLTLASIDQPFFSTKENGTGLGMFITKKIIVDHKGTLLVESQQSAWTKVWISLPLANETLH
ncbi:two-component system sensor histidine kinase NtrB [Sporosarcina ureae]|uniref:histidine kinase n=1 Tax=Sporosarcina ureae TaxID=1571 RepID=A0ABM6JYS3_SPOUR|nr:PAS domain S-box protein [Sporosarcina ureae]ARF15166.1 hypothetical protein SporoS204_14015 [Sporosarcina ureae]